MTDNKDSTITNILIGVAFGAILIYLLLRSPTQQTMQSQSNVKHSWKPMDIPRVDDIKPQTYQHIQPIVQQSRPVAQQTVDNSLVQKVSQLEDTTSQLEKTISQLRQSVNNQNMTSQPVIQQTADNSLVQKISRLEDTTSQLEKTISRLQQTANQQNTTLQTPNVIVEPLQTSQNNSQPANVLYKNNEKWGIVRGSDGRIKSLEIIRDVKKS